MLGCSRAALKLNNEQKTNGKNKEKVKTTKMQLHCRIEEKSKSSAGETNQDFF